MATYIITYDLSTPGRNYSALYDLIRAYGGYAHITESSWAVVTNSTAEEVRNTLQAAIDSNDKLFVGTLRAPAAWTGLDDERTNWLQSNLH